MDLNLEIAQLEEIFFRKSLIPPPLTFSYLIILTKEIGIAESTSPYYMLNIEKSS
jgi:hypothetical protein